MSRLRALMATLALLAALAALGGAAAQGVTGPAFYVDGALYRTVGTPTDLAGTGAPAHSFDIIYNLGGYQPNVATAAPGDPGFNGGRWQVHAIAYTTSYAATVAAHDTNGSGDLDSAAEVRAALMDSGAGGARDLGIVKTFECPVIKLPANE